MAINLAACVGELLDDNGATALGLGAGSDPRNPPAFRIPVPNNLFEIDAGKYDGNTYTTTRAFAAPRTTGFRAQIGLWAANYWEENLLPLRFPGNTPVPAGAPPAAGETAPESFIRAFKQMIYCAYVYGYVCTLNWPSPTLAPAAASDMLRWTTEVEVVDDDMDAPANETYDHNIALPDFMQCTDAQRDTWEDWRKICTLCVAAKLTWFATRHHMGTPTSRAGEGIGRDGDGRLLVGFTEKVLKATEGAPAWLRVEATNDLGATLVHHLIHPWCTIQVIRDVFSNYDPNAACVTHIKQPRQAGALLGCERGRFVFGSNILMRTSTAGAGMHKLTNIASGARHLLRSPIVALIPEMSKYVALLEEADRVRLRPLQYGENAPYLCTSSHHVLISDENIWKDVQAEVATFMRVCKARTSLCRAAVFRQDYTGLDGYSVDWNTVCTRLAAEMGSGHGKAASMVRQCLAFSSLQPTAQLSGAEVTALGNLGLARTAAHVNEVRDAIANAAQPGNAGAAPADAGDRRAAIVNALIELLTPP